MIKPQIKVGLEYKGLLLYIIVVFACVIMFIAYIILIY